MRRHRAIHLALIATILAALVGFGPGGRASSAAAAPTAPARTPYGFGDNYDGQLGLPFEQYDVTTATPVPGLTTIVAIDGGDEHTLFLTADGRVYSAGSNDYGQLGNGTQGTDGRTPTLVAGLPAGVTAIAAAGYHSMALAGGVVYTWGSNESGERGDGTPGVSGSGTLTPTPVTTLPAGVTAIATGGHDTHDLALVGGLVYSWGYNNQGQLGRGTVGTNEPTPGPVAGLPVGIAAIASGDYFSLAFIGGQVYAWGQDDTGQLGRGTISANEIAPAPVSNLPAGITTIVANGSHTLALRGSDGALFAWGRNDDGELGNGKDGGQQATPGPVLGPDGTGQLTGVVSFAAGLYHSLAVRGDGEAFGWGASYDGQLGLGSETGNQLSPQRVAGITGAAYAAAGDYFSFVLSQPGTATPSATSLTFGAQPPTTTSAAQAITLTNTGREAIVFAAFALSGDFAQTNDCAPSLPGGTSCTISVTFTPTQAGGRVGLLTIRDNASDSPQQITLFGTGATAATYTITASAAGSGTVTPVGTTAYSDGTVASYTAAPAAGQTFTGWTLDGTYVGYASPLTFTVSSNRTLVATFVATPTFADLGALSPADRQAITFLAARGIVNPAGVNGSGQFRPFGDVARAEIAAFIARTFGWESEFHANNFPDRCAAGDPTNCIDAKLWNDVAALKDYGIVGGYTDASTCTGAGTTAPCYLPRDGVKRVQVASIVARAFIKTPDLRPTGFWDRLATNPAQYTNVGTEGTQRSDLTTYRANAGEIPGQGDSATFANPGFNSTRLFVIQVLYQAYNSVYGVDRVP